MTEKLAAEIVKRSGIMHDTGMTAATPKPRAGEHTEGPVAPLFGVDWKDSTISLFTRDGFILARSNDSTKGKIYESIVALEAERDSLAAQKRELAQDVERVANSIDFVLEAMPAKMKPGLQAVADELRAAIAKHGR
jgi:hypothetical protein